MRQNTVKKLVLKVITNNISSEFAHYHKKIPPSLEARGKIEALAVIPL